MIAVLREFVREHFKARSFRNLILVYLIFMVLVNVLRDSVQGVENSLLMLVIAIGLILGWFLATLKVSGWKTGLIAFFSGGIILLIRIGRLGSLISTLFGQTLDIGTQTLAWVFQQGDLPRSTTLPAGVSELGSRISTLGSRLGVWIQSLFRGRPIFDPVATAFFWGILIWMIAIGAVWLTYRTCPVRGGEKNRDRLASSPGILKRRYLDMNIFSRKPRFVKTIERASQGKRM